MIKLKLMLGRGIVKSVDLMMMKMQKKRRRRTFTTGSMIW